MRRSKQAAVDCCAATPGPDAERDRQAGQGRQAQRTVVSGLLLKEQLRMIFHVGYDEAIGSLERWLHWARRCRVDAFVALARTVT